MAEYRKVDGFPYSVTSNGVVRNDRTGNVRKGCYVISAANLNNLVKETVGEQNDHNS